MPPRKKASTKKPAPPPVEVEYKYLPPTCSVSIKSTVKDEEYDAFIGAEVMMSRSVLPGETPDQTFNDIIETIGKKFTRAMIAAYEKQGFEAPIEAEEE